jgi:chromosome segregation ATPase
MSATPEPPEAARWALALNGIQQLTSAIRDLAEQQRGLQDQLSDLRTSYTRTAPMPLVQRLEERVGEYAGRLAIVELSAQRADARLVGLEQRTTTLESGTTAAILASLESDRAERRERQRLADRRATLDRLLWCAVILALLIDVALRLAGVL